MKDGEGRNERRSDESEERVFVVERERGRETMKA